MSRNRSRSGNRTEGGPWVNSSSVTAGDSQEDQMRPSMHHYLHHHRHSKWKVVLFNQLLSLIAILINFSPHATASPAVKRGGAYCHVYITHRPNYYPTITRDTTLIINFHFIVPINQANVMADKVSN